MEIRIASHYEIIGARDKWTHLVKSMKHPSVFLTWEWISTWIRHFEKDYTILILFISKNSEVVAIFPLAQRTMRLSGGFQRVNVITFCGTLECYPDHLDIICSKADDSDIYINMFFDFLRNDSPNWDILHFAFLAGEGNLSLWLQNKDNAWRKRLENKIISPYVPLEGDFVNLLAKMSAKKRYNLKRERKILFENKNISLKKVFTQDELNEALDELFRLHQARASEKQIKSTFKSKIIYSFHKDVSRIFLELGWLRLYLLCSNGKPISAAYGFAFDKRFWFYQTGLDPRWKGLSPGKIIIYCILEDIISENITEFDFLGGNNSYKTFWTKHFREMLTFNIFNHTTKASTEYLAIHCIKFLKHLLIKYFYYNPFKKLITRTKI